MKIHKKNNKLIVEIDYYQHHNNPYDEAEETELTHNLIGVICGDDQGIHHLVDLSYKDSQQVGELIVRTHLEKEKFIKLCEDLGISYHEYPICDYCHKPIFGAFGITDKGNQCFDCELKEKNKENKNSSEFNIAYGEIEGKRADKISQVWNKVFKKINNKK